MTSGGQVGCTNIGDIRAFLKLTVEEKGLPDRWFSSNLKVDLSKYY